MEASIRLEKPYINTIHLRFLRCKIIGLDTITVDMSKFLDLNKY